MKKSILVFAVSLISFASFSQAKPVKKDSTHTVAKADSIPQYYFTIGNLNEFLGVAEKQIYQQGWQNTDIKQVLNFLLQYLEQKKQYSIIAK